MDRRHDRVVSFLKPYGNAEALKVVKDLDAKVEALVPSAAAYALRSGSGAPGTTDYSDAINHGRIC